MTDSRALKTEFKFNLAQASTFVDVARALLFSDGIAISGVI